MEILTNMKKEDQSSCFFANSLEYTEICKIGEENGSSFYILMINKLRENYQKIKTAFKSRYPNFIIGYSYKTNYLPYLCKELSALGAYAEVVSRLEYDLAIKLGVDPKKIIFNGPLKSSEDIHYALKNRSIVNIDSIYEIEYVRDYCLQNQEDEFKIGIRLNFDISEDGESVLQEGYEISRFGICVENGSLQTALNELKKIKNLRVVGLHGHFSTRNRSVNSYKMITQNLCEIAKATVAEELEYIDIGGGIYGEIPKSFNMNTPTFDEYAEAICTIMNDEFKGFTNKPLLILEPGNSMVANTFNFVAKVIEVKKVKDKNFVLVDGSVHNIKPTMHKHNLPMEIIRQVEDENVKQLFNIVGYTCMEKDYLAHEVSDKLPIIGDYIIFENVGAYTIVFNPPFIKERPAIIAVDDTNMVVARKKETLKEFFNENLYYF